MSDALPGEAAPPSRWLTAAQAAARLGVKPQTLYAYVSRGLVRSDRVRGAGGGRTSRYDRSDIERLAGRRRGGGRAGALELLVDTELTLLDPAGRLYYRGRDATELAGSWSYERTAEWLWTGRDDGQPPPWRAPEAALVAARAATAGLGPDVALVDRMRLACVAAATTDPLRHDRRPEAVTVTGRALVSVLVETLPGPEGVEGGVAGRLWSRLAPEPGGAGVGVLDTALVLLADHELAASTFGARVAASTWADPYLVVETGLGVLGGPLHGGASEEALALLRDAAGTGPAEAIGRRLRSGSRIPGLGHSVYVGADPRAFTLLGEVRRVAGGSAEWATVEAVLDTLEGRNLPAPNIDLAVAAMAHCFGLRPGAGESVFAVSRCAGWLAHAIEEYRHRLRFRPRAVYTGTPV